MNNIKVKVTREDGRLIGYFVNPSIEIISQTDYEISGTFVNDQDEPFDKVEFNPQVVPYVVDVSGIKTVNFNTLTNGYIKRGRQPISISAKKSLGLT